MQAFFAPLRQFIAYVRHGRAASLRKRATPSVELVGSTKVDDLLKPSVLTNKDKGGENTADKRERAIREKLARFARVPASDVFKFVLLALYSRLWLTRRISNSLQPGSGPLGLSDEAAHLALERHGPNIFVTERPPRVISLLIMALSNPFNFILMALGIISIGTGDKATFTVMMVMIIASTSLRFVPLLTVSSCIRNVVLMFS